MSRIPPNPFNPIPFEMSYICQLIHSIESAYMPSTCNPMYSMPAQYGFGSIGGSIPQSGGFNLS